MKRSERGGERLHADTPAGGGDDGDEEGEHDQSLYLIDIAAHKKADRQFADNGDEKPRQAVEHRTKEPGPAAGGLLKTSEDAEEILNSFFCQNVNGVVDGDHADKVTVVVYHGDGEEVVFGHALGDQLPVGVGAHADNVWIADEADIDVRRGGDEGLQRDHADEGVTRVDDV